MSVKQVLTAAVFGWPIAVVVVFLVQTAVGAAPVALVYSGWMVLGCAPLAIGLLLSRRASSSMAQVLYDTEQAANPVSMEALQARLSSIAAGHITAPVLPKEGHR